MNVHRLAQFADSAVTRLQDNYAAKHGIAKNPNRAEIRVSAASESDRLIRQVRDDELNADGRPPRGTGIGLANDPLCRLRRFRDRCIFTAGGAKPRCCQVDMKTPLSLAR